jgi:hypothetical protein
VAEEGQFGKPFYQEIAINNALEAIVEKTKHVDPSVYKKR